jgi:hypothetical protein
VIEVIRRPRRPDFCAHIINLSLGKKMNTSKFLAVAAFATLAASASVAAQAGTSLGEASTLSPYAHQVHSSVDRASVVLAAKMNPQRTTLGESSGVLAQEATRVTSTRDRTEVREAAIQAERNGNIQSGEASYM